MPQFLVVAAIGAGLYAGYRLVAGLLAGEQEVPLRQHASTRRPIEKDLGRLELDPRTGIYRPTDRQG